MDTLLINFFTAQKMKKTILPATRSHAKITKQCQLLSINLQISSANYNFLHTNNREGNVELSDLK